MVPRESRARPRAHGRGETALADTCPHPPLFCSSTLALASPSGYDRDSCITMLCVDDAWSSFLAYIPLSTLGPARGIRACVGTGGKKGLVLHLYCHLPYHVTVTPRKEIRTAGQVGSSLSLPGALMHCTYSILGVRLVITVLRTYTACPARGTRSAPRCRRALLATRSRCQRAWEDFRLRDARSPSASAQLARAPAPRRHLT